jgi:hypothetical protein
MRLMSIRHVRFLKCNLIKFVIFAATATSVGQGYSSALIKISFSLYKRLKVKSAYVEGRKVAMPRGRAPAARCEYRTPLPLLCKTVSVLGDTLSSPSRSLGHSSQGSFTLSRERGSQAHLREQAPQRHRGLSLAGWPADGVG